MITIQPATSERPIAYVDTLGNQFCAQCLHADIPSRQCVTASPDDRPCDLCGRDMSTSIEIVTGTAVIEYVPCKIF